MNRINVQSLFDRAQALKSRAVVAAITLPVLAHAQATDPFDTAVTSITAKVTSYGGALVGLAAVAIAFYVAIKFVKKIPKAAG